MPKRKKRLKSIGNSKSQAKESPQPTSRTTSSTQSRILDPTTPGDMDYQIVMLSDWHIGSGSGRTGDIDSLILKDNEGFPYIPSKSITGIWRDACEQVAYGLDNGNEHGYWHQVLHYLFGDQPNDSKRAIPTELSPAALSIRSAHLDSSLRELILQKDTDLQQRYLQAHSFIKPGISVDPYTGIADDNMLRFEEMARAGLELSGTLQIQDPNFELRSEQEKRNAMALVLAGAYLIERIGGKRRRGAGRCLVTVLEQELNLNSLNNDHSLAWTKSLVSDSSDIMRWSTSQMLLLERNTGNYYSLKLNITAQTPLVITHRKIGNLVETLDYIPGTHLLSYILKKLSKLSEDVSYAVAHGEIVITNAYLSLGDMPGLPIPFALFGEKKSGGLSQKGIILNRFVEEHKGQAQLKGERNGYLRLLDNNIFFGQVSLGIQTHNTIDDPIQRPSSDVGGVYSYQSIAAGTTFIAELKLPHFLVEQFNQKNSKWIQSLQGNTLIGLSKKDDYGKISITPSNDLQTCKKTILPQKKTLTVWLLSELLLRDQALRPTSDPEQLAQSLADELGISSLKLRKRDNLLSSMARQNRLDSWQVRWGLPRPTLTGLSKGSCFVFEWPERIAPEILDGLSNKLAELSVKGLGERRAEGYGQLSFDAPLLIEPATHRTIRLVKDSPNMMESNLNNLPKSKRNADTVYLLERTVIQNLIQEKATALASDPKKRERILGMKYLVNSPTLSQWGNVRALVQSGTIDIIKTRINQWANHQHEKMKDDSTRPWAPLTELVNEDQIWQEMFDISDVLLVRQHKENLKKKFAPVAIRALINECIRSHKRDLEKYETEANVNREVVTHG